MSEHDRAVHSYMRFSACGACGDLDGCHLWREDERDAAVNPEPPTPRAAPRETIPGPAQPVYLQRFAEHREIERGKADTLIRRLPVEADSAETFGRLVYEILTAPEKVAAVALSRLGFQNAEMTTVDGKTIIRFRANGKQFIVAVAADS